LPPSRNEGGGGVLPCVDGTNAAALPAEFIFHVVMTKPYVAAITTLKGSFSAFATFSPVIILGTREKRASVFPTALTLLGFENLGCQLTSCT
jgi:hypothetical protein